MSTPASLLALFAFVTVVLLALETKTLSDDVPDNHITAVVRSAVRRQPGVFIWLMFSIGFLCGHLFWP